MMNNKGQHVFCYWLILGIKGCALIF